jgi:hypothetical protein
MPLAQVAFEARLLGIDTKWSDRFEGLLSDCKVATTAIGVKALQMGLQVLQLRFDMHTMVQHGALMEQDAALVRARPGGSATQKQALEPGTAHTTYSTRTVLLCALLCSSHWLIVGN